ncbi:hypothetical protein Clacol_002699 [Clathrus columnatus]|uniref:BZIP domain-containing protein n=1 Tax=Clathrus columnatus TaxID=1419009 RepID=A0AAV5A7D7_9AGAM|nr:hypothetical protein Clacol_002699 [Clathrus columnatus]
MRIRSSSCSPPALSLDPLPPTPIPSAANPIAVVSPKRETTEPPFDELPMSHLISFPLIDSPTTPENHDQPFEHFNSIQNPYSAFQSSSALLRDAFDYYRLPNNNPTPISDALNMSLHGSAFKSQLHHSIQDISSALSFAQQCIPTSHLFSTATSATSVSPPHATTPISPSQSVKPPPSPVEDQCNTSLFSNSSGQIVIPPSVSNSGSPTISQPQPSKKRPPRATISTKDFVPPDVSGLSKREARLVKNRAAAFLSRQRKREEFECMELRVAQLEQENARLLVLAQQYSSSSSRSPSPSQSSNKLSQSSSAEPTEPELLNLRGLLAESRARATELEKQLERLHSNNSRTSCSSSSDSGSEVGSPGGGGSGTIQIKRESISTDIVPNKRSSAGLFGVVLLCALPSLLSLPTPTIPHAASRFSFTPGPGSVNHHSAQTESLLDWTGMDIDDSASGSRRRVNLPLSFLNSQGDTLQNFMNGGGPDISSLPPIPPDFEAGSEAEFDVSFVPSPTEGKIRIRIEGPSLGITGMGSSSDSSAHGGAPGSSPRSSSLDSPSFAHSSPSDSWDLDFSAPDHTQSLMWDSHSPSAATAAAVGANVDLSMFSSEVSTTSSRRRIRISLKNGPVAGAEGGEWEVED